MLIFLPQESEDDEGVDGFWYTQTFYPIGFLEITYKVPPNLIPGKTVDICDDRRKVLIFTNGLLLEAFLYFSPRLAIKRIHLSLSTS